MGKVYHREEGYIILIDKETSDDGSNKADKELSLNDQDDTGIDSNEDDWNEDTGMMRWKTDGLVIIWHHVEILNSLFSSPYSLENGSARA